MPDRSLPPADGVPYPATDAHGRDPDGRLVGVLLFVRDGYLDDVEVYGLDDVSEFGGLPDPASLKHSEWSKPDQSGVRRLLNE